MTGWKEKSSLEKNLCYFTVHLIHQIGIFNSSFKRLIIERKAGIFSSFLLYPSSLSRTGCHRGPCRLSSRDDVWPGETCLSDKTKHSLSRLEIECHLPLFFLHAYTKLKTFTAQLDWFPDILQYIPKNTGCCSIKKR